MENNLNTNRPQTTEKIPHSGNLPGELRETPMRHFDTPLADAPVNPLDINDFTPTEVVTTAPEKKKSRKGLLIGASAGLAGVALVAGSIMGISAANSGEKETEPPVTDPKGTVEVEETPVEPTTPEEFRAAYEASLLRGEALTEHFTIPAGLTDQELGVVIIDKITEWENYGANKQLDAWISNDLFEDSPTLQEKVDDVASINAYSINKALFTADWQQKESLVQFADRLQHNNASTLGFFWQTTIDPEPYRTWAEVTTVNGAQLDEHSRELEVSFVEYANTDKNRSHELGQTSARTPEGREATITFSLISDGESERIADIK